MGQVLNNNKSKLTIVVVALFLLFSETGVHASSGELELFNKGYEDYLAYRPEEAVEKFRTFLSEFPGSSVRDTAMFWLGKSFVHLGNLTEAKKVFSDLKQQFPESPLIVFVTAELEAIEKTPPEGKPAQGEDLVRKDDEEKSQVIAGLSVTEAATKTPEGENGPPAKPSEDINLPEGEQNLPSVAEAKSAPDDAAGVAGNETEKSDMENEKEGTGLIFVEITESPSPAEHDLQPASAVAADPSGAEAITLPAEIEIPEAPSAGDLLSTGDEKQAAAGQPVLKEEDATESSTDSSFVLARLNIGDVIWESGNVSEDEENEGILYEEAKKSNISIDEIKYEELVFKYDFKPGQAGYLKRYLAICEFLDRKLKDMPEERMVESLIVKYEEGNKYRKIVIAPDLQKDARTGVPFEEIQKTYPDLVRVSVSGYDEVADDVKEKILYLQNNEIGVIWSEEGYTILKPALKKLSCKPFGETGPGIRNKIRAFVAELLAALKRQKK